MPHLSPRYLLFISVLLSCLLSSARADTLEITSTPSGATVELNGVFAGTTPFEKSFPGGYFHRTHTAFGSWNIP
jgi:hypothetical protein